MKWLWPFAEKDGLLIWFIGTLIGLLDAEDELDEGLAGSKLLLLEPLLLDWDVVGRRTDTCCIERNGLNDTWFDLCDGFGFDIGASKRSSLSSFVTLMDNADLNIWIDWLFVGLFIEMFFDALAWITFNWDTRFSLGFADVEEKVELNSVKSDSLDGGDIFRFSTGSISVRSNSLSFRKGLRFIWRLCDGLTLFSFWDGLFSR